MNFSDVMTTLQAWIFETIVQPAMFSLGLGEFVEDAFEGVEWFIFGALQLFLVFIILRPMESWIPVQKIENRYAFPVQLFCLC